jgi:hypothetical protein
MISIFNNDKTDFDYLNYKCLNESIYSDNNDLTVHNSDHCNFYCDINDKSVPHLCTCIEIDKYIKCSCIVTDKCDNP